MGKWLGGLYPLEMKWKLITLVFQEKAHIILIIVGMGGGNLTKPYGPRYQILKQGELGRGAFAVQQEEGRSALRNNPQFSQSRKIA